MALSSGPQLVTVKPITAHPSRRASARVAAMLPVELIFSYGSGNTMPARSIDIGMGGMCIQTSSIIDSQAVDAVRFNLGGNRVGFDVCSPWNIDLGGSGGPATGLVFESLDGPKKDALWDFIQGRGRDLGSFLTSCEGLEQLLFEESLELALATRLREFAAGDLIYRGREEDTSSSISVVMTGSVVLELADGRCNQQISQVGPRELFGGLPIVAGCAPIERAIAIEETRILEFSAYAAENLLNTKPHLGVSLLRAASFHWMRRFAETLERVIS